MVFDLLELDGKSLPSEPLSKRRERSNNSSANNAVAGLQLSPMTGDRATRFELARAQRRRARRRHRQARRPGIPLGRAGDDQGQAAAHRRLRRRRLPLCRKEAGGRLAAARPLRRRGPARPCRLHLRDPGRRAAGADREARSADRAAGLHRQRARRPEPLEHRAVDGVGAAEAGAGGRGPLRPGHRPPLPPRHRLRPLAARQGPEAMHLRAARAGAAPVRAQGAVRP